MGGQFSGSICELFCEKLPIDVSFFLFDPKRLKWVTWTAHFQDFGNFDVQLKAKKTFWRPQFSLPKVVVSLSPFLAWSWAAVFAKISQFFLWAIFSVSLFASSNHQLWLFWQNSLQNLSWLEILCKPTSDYGTW